MGIMICPPMAKNLLEKIPKFYENLPIKRLNWEAKKIKENDLVYGCWFNILLDNHYYSMNDIDVVGDISKILSDGKRDIALYTRDTKYTDPVHYSTLPDALRSGLYLIGVCYDIDDDYDEVLKVLVSTEQPDTMNAWGAQVISIGLEDQEAKAKFNRELDVKFYIILHHKDSIEIIMVLKKDNRQEFAEELCLSRGMVPLFYQNYYDDNDDVSIVAIHCIETETDE